MSQQDTERDRALAVRTQGLIALAVRNILSNICLGSALNFTSTVWAESSSLPSPPPHNSDPPSRSAESPRPLIAVRTRPSLRGRSRCGSIHQLSKCDAQSIIQWPVSAYSHNVFVVLKAWPIDLLSLDHMHLNPGCVAGPQWQYRPLRRHPWQRGHRPETAGARRIHRKINGVADAGFGRIHVAAKRLRNNRTARFPTCRGDSDAAEEGMQREFSPCTWNQAPETWRCLWRDQWDKTRSSPLIGGFNIGV